MPHRLTLSLLVLLAAMLTACAARAPQRTPGLAPQQEQFWAQLRQLCGEAFAGQVIEAPETDTTFAGQQLVMHVRECMENEIRIPFHVGEDRSRTWVVTRTDTGLRLKHDHRHEDGTPDTNTDYGGDTAAQGTATRQEFPADAYSIRAVPARATQHWYLELHPGRHFVYGLLREETGMRYRMEFDLTRPVPPPPPPWGVDVPGL